MGGIFNPFYVRITTPPTNRSNWNCVWNTINKAVHGYTYNMYFLSFPWFEFRKRTHAPRPLPSAILGNSFLILNPPIIFFPYRIMLLSAPCTSLDPAIDYYRCWTLIMLLCCGEGGNGKRKKDERKKGTFIFTANQKVIPYFCPFTALLCFPVICVDFEMLSGCGKLNCGGGMLISNEEKEP